MKRELLNSDRDLSLDVIAEYTKSNCCDWEMYDFLVTKSKTTRHYKNKMNGATISSVIKRGIVFLKNYHEDKGAKVSKIKPTLKELQENPITVSLLPIVIDLCNQDPEDEDCENIDNCEFSGRIIYALNDAEDEDYFEMCDQDHVLEFCCGPETESGALDDRGEDIIDDKLKTLFHDLDITIQASEHFHMIELGTLKAKDVWKIVENRLIRSGAVKMKEWK